MNVIVEFNSVMDLVDKLLKLDKRCRNDDKWLVYRVLRHYTPVYIPFTDFKKFPSFLGTRRDGTQQMIINDFPSFLVFRF